MLAERARECLPKGNVQAAQPGLPACFTGRLEQPQAVAVPGTPPRLRSGFQMLRRATAEPAAVALGSVGMMASSDADGRARFMQSPRARARSALNGSWLLSAKGSAGFREVLVGRAKPPARSTAVRRAPFPAAAPLAARRAAARGYWTGPGGIGQAPGVAPEFENKPPPRWLPGELNLAGRVGAGA